MRYDDDAPDMRGYTTAPGILLVITGIVYLLVGLALLVIGLVWTGITSTPEFQREYRKEFTKEINKNPRMTPEQRKEAEAVGKGIEQGMYVSGPTMLGWGLLSLPSGILVLVGGITMMRMRAYALSMFAAVVAVLPCSPCCFLGLIGGIYGFIVLMNPEIRSAFR